MEKIRFITKIKNAYKMLKNEGFGPLFYKIQRFSYHKTKAFIRKIFPYEGKRLREAANNYVKSDGSLPSLSIIIPILGHHDMTQFCINKIIEHHKQEIEILVVDNGNDFIAEPIPLKSNVHLKVVHPEEGNIGVYPVFDYGIRHTEGEIILFMHNDLILNENGFDILLKYVFAKNKDFGLVGFVGSDEINENGGRGWGTTSNLEKKTYTYKDKTWTGPPAELFGSKFDGLTNAVFIDACSMAIRRSTWEKIGFRKDFPISSHSHDRLTCMQVLEAGQRIAVLGVACDHMDGQTRFYPIDKKYPNAYQIWCEKNNIPKVFKNDGSVDWDWTMRYEAKRLFLKEWRDEKKFIPRRV
ncbi:MAG: glycosyltransferase [Candidatus Paceibacterota bacterium]|jgi:GT2 family glycosyltransferase